MKTPHKMGRLPAAGISFPSRFSAPNPPKGGQNRGRKLVLKAFTALEGCSLDWAGLHLPSWLPRRLRLVSVHAVQCPLGPCESTAPLPLAFSQLPALTYSAPLWAYMAQSSRMSSVHVLCLAVVRAQCVSLRVPPPATACIRSEQDLCWTMAVDTVRVAASNAGRESACDSIFVNRGERFARKSGSRNLQRGATVCGRPSPE